MKLVKVDVDNFQDLAMKYRVRISKGDMELVDDLCIASTKYMYIYISWCVSFIMDKISLFLQNNEIASSCRVVCSVNEEA